MPATPISPSRPNSWSVPDPKLTEQTQTFIPLPIAHPDFAPVLGYLRQRLHPLVSCTTGQIPPDFPETMLSYHLLTNSQLDKLAQFFHQTSQTRPETWMYPTKIQKPWVGTNAEVDVNLETKRRRFGRFIGLRGCDSPVEDRSFFHQGTADVSNITTPDMEDAALWEMVLCVEKEWQAALAKAQDHFGWK
ncbi:hypothetical protein N7520_000303 [Penicillium odoratum]|uniref:uncharacterized protein n=1 Tax=Penicillium odoratum TaxID=1167516 RepID=UPI002548D392|nr:uncharacterized protein N7520_000303 [Penicillium odoratum]KAJ5777057.1 hypothetical protein N7520_000303 [Penicillium odoratum]